MDETVAGIKRQHNVFEQLGIDPQAAFGYKIIEPLIQLRKDGVRKVGEALGLPAELREGLAARLAALSLNRYPEAGSVTLTERFAASLGVAPGQLLPGTFALDQSGSPTHAFMLPLVLNNFIPLDSAAVTMDPSITKTDNREPVSIIQLLSQAWLALKENLF